MTITAVERRASIEERRRLATLALEKAEVEFEELAFAVAAGDQAKAKKLADCRAEIDGLKGDIAALDAAIEAAGRHVQRETAEQAEARRREAWGKADMAADRAAAAARDLEAAAKAFVDAHTRLLQETGAARSHAWDAGHHCWNVPSRADGPLNSFQIDRTVEALTDWITGGRRPERQIGELAETLVAQFKAMEKNRNV